MEPLQLPVVFGVGIFAGCEFFLIGIVARIDAHFFHVLDRLHRRGGQKVNVRHQGHRAKTGGGELLPDLPEAFCGGHVRGGDPHDLAAHLGQRDALADGGVHVLRVAGGHRLQPERIRSADSDGAHLHGNGEAADGVKAGRAVGMRTAGGGASGRGGGLGRGRGGLMGFRPIGPHVAHQGVSHQKR